MFALKLTCCPKSWAEIPGDSRLELEGERGRGVVERYFVAPPQLPKGQPGWGGGAAGKTLLFPEEIGYPLPLSGAFSFGHFVGLGI